MEIIENEMKYFDESLMKNFNTDFNLNKLVLNISYDINDLGNFIYTD